MSARQEDLNGFIEIKGNPLSKVGVFRYLGAEISSNLIANKIYNVYRPEEELSSDECIASFKLIPFTDDHSFLGASADGLMPAEKKGVHGTTGEDIYFESPYLKGNLKLFSESIAKEIEDGKQEISIGYRSDYEPTIGIYNGIKYELIQRNIRGNHVALVDEGRSGHDVKVLDCYKFITLDSGVLRMEEEDLSSTYDEKEDEKSPMTLESLASKLEAIEKKISELTKKKEGQEDEIPKNPYAKSEDEGTEKKLLNEDEGEEEEEDEDEEVENEEKEEKRESKDKKSKDKKSKDKKSMDSSSFKKVLTHISQRDSLVNLLKPHIGVFDHTSKTLQEVAEYGVKKLGIPCSKGQEEAVLSGYFLGRKYYSSSLKSSSMDSKITDNALEEYISEGANV